jgi:DNA invertase Pin-like site-specific DNA recombinase
MILFGSMKNINVRNTSLACFWASFVSRKKDALGRIFADAAKMEQGGPNRLPAPSNSKMKREMTDDERKEAFTMLEMMMKNGKLQHGSFTIVAKKFGVHVSTISRIWARGRRAHADGLNKKPDVRSLKFNRGRLPKYIKDDFDHDMQLLPLSKRKTLRSLASSLGLSLTTTHRMVSHDDSTVYRHKSSLKPSLTEQNKADRVTFCFDFVREHGRMRLFDEMLDIVHVDEKWFYVTEQRSRYYLV